MPNKQSPKTPIDYNKQSVEEGLKEDATRWLKGAKIGTEAALTLAPVGKVASLVKYGADRVVGSIIARAVAKHGGDAEKVGVQVAKDIATHLKRPIVSARPGEVVNVKPMRGTASVTEGSRGATNITSDTKNISYVKKGVSLDKASAAQKGLDTARNNTIDTAGNSAKSASIGMAAKAVGTGFKAGQNVGKVKGAVAGAVAGVGATVAVNKAVDKSKNGK